MNTHRWTLALLRAGVALACAAGLSGAALAARGGGGGSGGDSSMNPYTGDSYAYFHGGHNLGEPGTIRPGGTPPPTGYQLWPPRGAPADAPRASAPQPAFQPAPDPNATRDAPVRRQP
ncbi:MAG TPA: hypothetical protein VLR71_02860 [Casimicrobiaceae bacterium]|nr:hypothetical protein [Casimicrobiaceae bacterium]